jgi:hypothetical protein
LQSAGTDGRWVELGRALTAARGRGVQWGDVTGGPGDDPKSPRVRVGDARTGQAVVGVADFDSDGQPDVLVWNERFSDGESDVEFLRRVIKDVRGTSPTALEEKYFAEDKDPKKREKLLDLLLRDPAAAKKLGDDWKKKMLAAPPVTWSVERLRIEAGDLSGFEWTVDPKHLRQLELKVDPRDFKIENPPANPKVPKPVQPQADRTEKLVGELLAAKKSDAEMLEAITLAALGRLPTDAEKRLTLGLVATAADRKAAWVGVARALSATEEATRRAEPKADPTSPPEK